MKFNCRAGVSRSNQPVNESLVKRGIIFITSFFNRLGTGDLKKSHLHL
jgi:hypothetical protein